jgi:hypothetical protein
MTDDDDTEDTIQFFRQCTDAQLEHNLKKKWEAYKHRNYNEVRIAAAERGWTVRNGKRIN